MAPEYRLDDPARDTHLALPHLQYEHPGRRPGDVDRLPGRRGRRHPDVGASGDPLAYSHALGPRVLLCAQLRIPFPGLRVAADGLGEVVLRLYGLRRPDLFRDWAHHRIPEPGPVGPPSTAAVR